MGPGARPRPDNHLSAGPHSRVAATRAGSAGGCPSVGAGIVSAAGVQPSEIDANSTPSSTFFAASPDCRVIVPEQRARW